MSLSSIELSPSDIKVKHLAKKYQKYRNKAAKKSSVVGRSIQLAFSKLRYAWQKIVPVYLRGWSSDYEQFNSLWQNEVGKPCSREQVSSLSVEDCLTYNNGQKTVLGLLYTPASFRTIITFVGSLPLDKTRNVLLCPINIDSAAFQKIYQEKVGYYTQSVIVLWKGLFDQIIVLGRKRIGQSHLWEQITLMTTKRDQYESNIKNVAFENSQNNYSGLCIKE